MKIIRYDSKDFNLDYIREALRGFEGYTPPTRHMSIRTGPGGYERFNEVMENKMGLKRVYSSKQLPRIFRIKLRKAVTGRYYRLIKM